MVSDWNAPMSLFSIMPLAGPAAGLLVFGCAVPPDPLGLGAESGSGQPSSSGAVGEAGSSTSSGSGEPADSSGSLPDPSGNTTGGGSSSDGTTTVALTASTTWSGEDSTTGVGLGESTGGGESTGIECMVEEVECGAACCVYQDEACAADVCGACELVDDFDAGAPVWTTNGDWGIHLGAPQSPTNPAVPFGTAVFGTNGNRVSGGSPDDEEIENSEVLTTQLLLGNRLRFSSWHVDEGGSGSGWDNKVVQLLIGGQFYTLVNCEMGVDPQAFCSAVMGPRAADDWDTIVLDTSAYSGMVAQLRLRYLSITAIGSFEQGWYVDELRVGDGCGPPT